AMAASDITMVKSDPRQIPQAIRLSRRTLSLIKGNLFWAFAYNTAAIPIAALGLLDPMIAGAAMAFSSVFVILNSLRLLRFEEHRAGSGTPRPSSGGSGSSGGLRAGRPPPLETFQGKGV